MKLDEWPEGYGRRVLDRVDSTLDEARRVAPDLAGPEWILALQQTAARGRRGRVWHSPEGNFAATLVMRPEGPPAQAALRSFVAALALADALEAVLAGRASVSLKWPNDVLLNGGKVAGILLESIGAGAQVGHLAIGIGVNLAGVPDPAVLDAGAVPAVSVLQEAGIEISPTEFLTCLAVAFARHDAQFATYGFAPVRTAWLARAARLGEVITARTGTATWQGTFADVDDAGNLVLDTSKGVVAIPAADVYF